MDTQCSDRRGELVSQEFDGNNVSELLPLVRAVPGLLFPFTRSVERFGDEIWIWNVLPDKHVRIEVSRAGFLRQV